MTQLWQLSLWWIVLLAANGGARTQTLNTANGSRKPEATIFYMDGKGSYKYAFASDNGLEGEQSANRANEVTGYYTYYDEQGAPYMVKYRAGVLGYQPEVIRAPTSGNNAAKPTSQTAKALSDEERSGISSKTEAAALVEGALQPSTSSTLKFVQHAMQSMQTQPLQVSFSAQQSHLPAAPPPQSLLGNVQVHKRTTLAEPPQQQQLVRPYAYSYLADQSAHSESADRLGNVLGKYSYYDEAGYHDLSYSAGDDTGFVIVGGNLVKSKSDAVASPSSVPNQLVVNFSQLPPGSSYNYRVAAAAKQNAVTLNSLEEHSAGADDNTFRSLRKFRRYAKW